MPKSQFRRPLKLALIALLTIAGVGEYRATALRPEAGSSQTPEVSFEQGFAPVVQRVRPAVVNIASSRIVRTVPDASPLFSDPFLNELFDSFQMPRERREHSLGSGVIVSNAGYVMTNSHVVELLEKPVAAEPARPDYTGPRFGLTVEPLTSEILIELGLPADTHGVIISDVEPGSAAEEAGLRFGDIIQEVNRKRVTSVMEFRNAMQDADTMVMLLVNRQGEHAFVALEGPREPAR